MSKRARALSLFLLIPLPVEGAETSDLKLDWKQFGVDWIWSGAGWIGLIALDAPGAPMVKP